MRSIELLVIGFLVNVLPVLAQTTGADPGQQIQSTVVTGTVRYEGGVVPIQYFPVDLLCSDKTGRRDGLHTIADESGEFSLHLPLQRHCVVTPPDDSLKIEPSSLDTPDPRDPYPPNQSEWRISVNLIVADTPARNSSRLSGFSSHGLISKRPTTPKSLDELSKAVVRIFYATDRLPVISAKGDTAYGPDESGVEALSYGVCSVSIPRDHRMGKLESPSLWRLEWKTDPEKHIVLQHVVQESSEQFYSEVSKRIQSSSRKDAFVFIHGYNVSFDDAARRTAQIAYDLGFQGAPILYSWPSRGSLLSYSADEDSVQWSAKHLKTFLEKVATSTGAERVHLIAHSMGNRALLEALSGLSSRYDNIQEVVLAAPDISVPLFRQLVPSIQLQGKRVTLYASSKDQALLASETAHHYPRAGEAAGSLVVLPPIETIDASEVDTGFIAHSYVMEDKSLLSDIYYLLGTDKPAGERFALVRKISPQGIYWQLSP